MVRRCSATIRMPGVLPQIKIKLQWISTPHRHQPNIPAWEQFSVRVLAVQSSSWFHHTIYYYPILPLYIFEYSGRGGVSLIISARSFSSWDSWSLRHCAILLCRVRVCPSAYWFGYFSISHRMISLALVSGIISSRNLISSHVFSKGSFLVRQVRGARLKSTFLLER